MSEKEQAGSKAGLVTHEDDSERRFWCRVVRKCIPRMGMARAVEAADLAVLALRERSVASGIHAATGSAFERLVTEHREMEERLTRERDQARKLLDQQTDTVAGVIGAVGVYYSGKPVADVRKVVTRLEEVEGDLDLSQQTVVELRAELGTLRAEVDRLRQALRGNSHEISAQKDR